nr:hypothetical protein GCM10025699_16750 [Microbacterium flavescens]
MMSDPEKTPKDFDPDSDRTQLAAARHDADDDDDDDDDVEHIWQVNEIRLGVLSGALLLAGFLLGLAGFESWELWLSIAALIAGAATFVPGAVRDVFKGKIGIGTLMTVGAVGAAALGQFEEAATLAFLYSLSEGLEEYSVAKTRRGLRALLDLVPDEAVVRRDGAERTIATAELVLGDLMLVKPGERLATDGIIRTGRTALDLSAITGESMPVEASPAMRCSPAPSTAPAPSRSRSPQPLRTTPWPGSCTSSRRNSPGKARPSDSPTESPSPSFPAS